MLFNTYPSDPIVGEESASDLRNEAAISLRERIITLANEYIEKELEEGEMAEWGIGPGKAKSGTDLLDAIDRGNFTGGRTGRKCTPRLISLSSHTHTIQWEKNRCMVSRPNRRYKRFSTQKRPICCLLSSPR